MKYRVYLTRTEIVILEGLIPPIDDENESGQQFLDGIVEGFNQVAKRSGLVPIHKFTPARRKAFRNKLIKACPE